MKLHFNSKYFIIAIIIFLVEVFIALYIKDKFIRPYGGDILVVVLIYSFIKSFFKVDALKLAICVFIFSCAVELGQYLNLIELLGLAENKLARIVIGTSFAWEDIAAYLAGAIITYFLDVKILEKQAS